MIELFYSSSPNVYKVMIGLEDLRLPYEIVFVDLSKGEQFDPAKMAGSPTAKVPVIRDNEPTGGGAPLTVFESGAILQYLAEKTGRLLPPEPPKPIQTLQWLYWQMANLGPIGGQYWHFKTFAPRLEPGSDFSYPQRRYAKMLDALHDVMERRLSDAAYLAGDYSIADIACFPWIKYLGAGDETARPNRFYEANKIWHEKIYRVGRNRFLQLQTEDLRLRVAPYRRFITQQPGRMTASIDEHASVVEAIRERRDEDAHVRMRNHVSILGYEVTDWMHWLNTAKNEAEQGADRQAVGT